MIPENADLARLLMRVLAVFEEQLGQTAIADTFAWKFGTDDCILYVGLNSIYANTIIVEMHQPTAIRGDVVAVLPDRIEHDTIRVYVNEYQDIFGPSFQKILSTINNR